MCNAAWNSCGQIWIPEIEYYQKMSSHAQIEPQGAEVMWVGGWVVVVGGGGMQPNPETSHD